MHGLIMQLASLLGSWLPLLRELHCETITPLILIFQPKNEFVLNEFGLLGQTEFPNGLEESALASQATYSPTNRKWHHLEECFVLLSSLAFDSL